MKNEQLKKLVSDLKKKSIEDNVGLWKRIAEDLEKPTRGRTVVNVQKLTEFGDDEILVVAGKILGNGEITKKVVVAANNFSESAKQKLIDSKSEMLSIEELMKKDPKKVRIVA